MGERGRGCEVGSEQSGRSGRREEGWGQEGRGRTGGEGVGGDVVGGAARMGRIGGGGGPGGTHRCKGAQNAVSWNQQG